MSDISTEDDFTKELEEAFAADDAVIEDNATPPAEDNKPAPDAPKVDEEPKKDDPANPADPNAKEDPNTPPAGNEEPPKEDPAKPKDPEAPTEPETPPAPQPLTEDGIRKLMSEMRNEERNSVNELSTATNKVVESYYPDGLSNVLVDQASGKELRTPQDVVDASGGDMSMEAAAQWLMNEQYKLDQNIAGIKQQAEKIAETTINFKRDSVAAIEKYAPLFEKYPQLQAKTFSLLKKQLKVDEAKDVVLEAPDVLDLYDTYLEPYQKAYEFATKQSATAPITTPPVTPPVATPGQSDRMDEGGDGGATTEIDDPNDFAQQVTKELAGGF
jgi:hypothetical protein